MAFSKQQQDAINAWLAKHNPKCPVCGTSPPALQYNNFIQLSEEDPSSSARYRVGTILCVGLVCKACGFVWLIDIQQAGVPKEYKKS